MYIYIALARYPFVLKEFNFLSEIRKENTYGLLYPEQKIGLAIILLYDKIVHKAFANNAFKEKDIHEALDEVNPKAEKSDSRHPKEHYNTVISDLQEYFLRYDDENQLYTFKEYAYEFCKKSHEILRANFDPTRIEKICSDLRSKLEQTQTADSIIDWFTISFDTFKPDLKQQIDFLDRQIDYSVADLRLRTNLSDSGIIELLKEVDTRLDEIRKQNKELRAAFREIEIIKNHLETLAMQDSDREVGDKIYDALLFFKEMKYLLGLVDTRLDRIQPKIKQLFSTLNKPLFNTRIEKFLRLLLDRSKIEALGVKKQIIFPNNIPPFSFRKDFSPSFTIFERKKDLFPPQRKKRPTYSENDDIKQQAFELSGKKILQHDEISSWIEKIELNIKKMGETPFTPFFFQIVKEKNGDFDLAVHVAYRVIREFSKNPERKIKIENYMVARKPYNNIALWEMTIA